MGFIKTVLSSAVLQTHFTSAVILAAGEGTRFGNEDGTKQNALVAGVPALVRACQPFEAAPRIKEIIIVAREDEKKRIKRYVAEYSLTKVTKIVTGGDTRAESSALGAAALSPKCKYVAIHDAARCLVTEKMIDDAVVAAYRYGAAACAEHVVDTVKITDYRGIVQRTEDRDHVWLVKTPQVFKLSIYETSSAICKQDGVSVTDDCMMAEHVGFKVKLVDCGHENIKLTERDDLSLAEFIISKRTKTEEEK